jgi:hypothetical protein
MTLKKKIMIILAILCLTNIFFIFLVKDIYVNYKDNPLNEPLTNNVFDNIASYSVDAINATITKERISTGMFTDANYKNFHVTIKIPADNPLIVESKNNKKAYVAFQSWLQGTKEWLINNKYSITMFYYPNEDYSTAPITFFNQQWVGLDRRVSSKIPIPKEAIGKSIYIDYASNLGSFLFLKNGNDIRFFDNYLSIK